MNSSFLALSLSSRWFGSAVAHRLNVCGISRPLYRDLGCGALDLAEIVRRKFHFSRADIFVETIHLGRARDWNDPRLLRQQPSQRDLSRCCLFLFGDSAQQIHQCMIRLAVLRCKSWERAPEVV